MKVSLKIKDLLPVYMEVTTTKYLCVFIRDQILFISKMCSANCGNALQSILNQYFVPTDSHMYSSTITGWFVHSRIHDSETNVYGYHLKTRDGQCIEVPDAYNTMTNLRFTMLNYVLERDPDVVLEFDTEEPRDTINPDYY